MEFAGRLPPHGGLRPVCLGQLRRQRRGAAHRTTAAQAPPGRHRAQPAAARAGGTHGQGTRMKNWQKRGAIIAGALIALGTASALVLNALNSNIALYVTPTEVLDGKAPEGRAFRIGGLVKQGSLRREELTSHFVITDTVKDINVSYTGLLPDLFK